jgi:parallel beta-helix repeat protein
MTILGEHTARTGDISILSRSGAIQLLATDLHAISGRIDVTAHGEILQSATDGIFLVDVINTGEFVAVDTPEVDVAIAEPAAGGGTAAEASAVVRQVGVQRENGQIIIFPQPGVVVEPQPNDVPVWGVVGYLITNPGDGYASGETPAVTIQGLPGASARAVAAGFVPFNVIAEDDVNITAGETVLLRNIVRSNVGSVTISSIDRDVNLSAAGQLVHTLAGDITIESLAGGITFNQLVPGRDLSLESFQPLAINQPLVVTGGSAFFGSTGFNVTLDADVIAADLLAISAKTGIVQNNGTINATDLLAENLTPTPITLAAAGNDVDRFSAFNTGAVTFNDANSFRVGLQTSGPMGVELTGGAVTLTAPGTIRVVAGIEADQLTMTAETVEFATTEATDNPNGAFAGTFRDMIEISNENTDLASDHVMVFDEPGYPIGEITVSRSLPAITRAVTIDGETADGGRLGVRGAPGVGTGVWFGGGSTGSSLGAMAFHGFSSGSALVIESGDNTVSDLWFGLRADGSPGLANRIGVNVSGDRAFNNLIGSELVFDPTTANRFAGHTDAAIVLQRGASNNLVAGNLVGGDGLTANRTGVRVDGGSGNRIGTPDQVTPDLRPTESNRIAGNSHYGIEIRNVRGSTTLVENNVVAGNATKVGSGTHGIGVLNSAFVQIGGVSELSRNQVFGSLGGSGIHLSGSNHVRIVGNAIGTDGYHLSANGHTNDYDANRPDLGNHLHGIHVFGRSRDVLIDSNRIVDNERSGVAIASGSSGVLLTNNEIGVWVHPVTGNVHAAGNDADGVTITAANGNTIGRGNLIGYNGGSGIMVENSVAAGLATGNRLAGAELFGNLGHGIHVSGSSRQTVGGYSGQGNVIKENALDGIRVENDPRIRASAAPHGNVVAGNFVGTNDNQEIDRNWGNRNGITVMNGVENVLAGNVVMNNRAHGIEIGGGDGNTLGGQIESAGNFVGYNFRDGVNIHDQASTQLQVGVVGTAITNPGAGYAASRTSVIFTAPADSGGVPARGVAIISAAGQVTGIRLTSSGSGYEIGEPVSVQIFDPQATAIATATVTLGPAARRPDGVAAVSEVSRRHVVSGNEIEANNGAGVYVKGDRTTEIQIGQDLNGRAGRGLGNKISFHDVGILIDAAGRTSLQGNELGDNGMPIDLINGANQDGFGPVEVTGLTSTAWGRGQTRVTGTIINANKKEDGKIHEFWVNIYATPHYDLDEDVNGKTYGHEMRTFLGRTLVTTDATGRATLSLVVSEGVGLGDSISLTLTSNRYEDGSTVGVWHSARRHGVDLSSSPTTGSPTVTPTNPGGSSGGGASTPGRAPVAPRG